MQLFCRLASSHLIPWRYWFYLSYASLLKKIRFNNNNDSEAASMFHVVHLIHVFFCWHEKGLLNFVSERIKLVYRINNTRLAFQTSKTTIYRPHTPELKSISKFQLLFHWRNFEKYMVFYTLPWSRWNRIHTLWHTCVVLACENMHRSY